MTSAPLAASRPNWNEFAPCRAAYTARKDNALPFNMPNYRISKYRWRKVARYSTGTARAGRIREKSVILPLKNQVFWDWAHNVQGAPASPDYTIRRAELWIEFNGSPIENRLKPV